MTKFNTSSVIFWLPVIIIVAIVSCNQPNDKRVVNNEMEDSSQVSSSSNNDDMMIPLDSVEYRTIEGVKSDSYTVDCDESCINWFCVTHSGYVKFREGTTMLADGNIVEGNFEICMDSISNIDIDYQLMKEVLENTLKSADFFDVEKFPLGYFNLVRVMGISDDSFEVVGNLSIKDVTNQIRFKTSIKSEDSLISVESERFAINRTKWGLTIYSENFEQTDKSFLFTDMVEIQISLKLIKELSAVVE